VTWEFTASNCADTARSVTITIRSGRRRSLAERYLYAELYWKGKSWAQHG